MKILFFGHDGKLGDAVVHTAFVDAVLRLDPAAELHVLASGIAHQFWTADRRICRVWRFDHPALGECLRTCLAVRRERYDYLVTWKARFHSEKTRLLLRLAAPLRGALHEDGCPPGGVAHALRKCELSLHAIYGACAQGLDLRYRLDMALDLPGSFAELPPRREVILFNRFAAEPRIRTVQPEAAVAILRGLAAMAPQALLVLSCCDDTEAAARASAAAAGRRCLVINTGASLRRLVSLCARADLVVSTDTSLIHLASALDKPVLGIYQNDGIKPVEWAPRSLRSAVVVGPHPDCIHGFSVAEVLEKAAALRAPLAQAPAA